MGKKDWYWGSGAASKTPMAATTNSSSKRAAAPADTTTPTGCISAVFQFLDFHHFQLPLNHNQTTTTTSSSSGCGCFKLQHSTEPPRNSLESEEETSASASASASAPAPLTSTSKEENLNIPMGIQIKTRGDNRSKVGASNNDTSSEMSSSPGTKTPTLVARLMGLDILPESNSPSFSSNSHLKPLSSHRRSLDGDIRGSRSLPETPRISSSSRRSDVDLHHRLSLQINRENISATENRSPGHYARQIVKQVKESVSRKFGTDITNTVRNREQAREELVSQFKYKKNCRSMSKLAEDSNSITRKPVTEEQDEHKNQQPPRATRKCKKTKKPQQITSDIIRNKKEEPFVRPSTANRIHIPDKKCKKTPLSNDLLNTTVPTLFPVKKHPSPPATKIPQKQVSDAGRPKRSTQLSSCSSQTYNKQEATYVHVPRHDNIGDRCNDGCTTTGEAAAAAEYHEYIARILRRTGLEKDTPLSLASWFSPSHPLNPSIFYYLEHFTTCNKKTSSTQLSLRCNRKLLFHLTDEILTEFLKPLFNMKPWVISGFGREWFSNMNGSQLIDTLCSKITGFPRADCRVLEDIDALIDKDLPEMKLRCSVAYEEEGETVVSEIGKDILEELVHETAADLRVWCTGFNFQRLSDRSVERGRLLESHGAFT
ncbi:TON1 Recruiting Motif 25 [Hibiscus trionum]|uniref:TON1 Recruiting Motif 25 n=1 Tax=Hibiscus trionum TaxID=183268 RepID=A0A9W7IR04_HIBTR|nr:TON1 Recruiting Motif 25 [Hibiscus trionum]